MGSYKFTWDQPADEVLVTGTFDNWAKSQKLEKVGDHFETTIEIAESTDKILYKFVVNGEWATDSTATTETDQEGNLNNVLTSSQLAVPKSDPPAEESDPKAKIEAAPVAAAAAAVPVAAAAVAIATKTEAKEPVEPEKTVEEPVATEPTPTEPVPVPAAEPEPVVEQKTEEAAEPATEAAAAAPAPEVTPEVVETKEITPEAVPEPEVSKDEPVAAPEKAVEPAPIVAEKPEEPAAPTLPVEPAVPDAMNTINTVTPESTTAALAKNVPLEKDIALDAAAVPGGFPETPAGELEDPVEVKPLPAADGALNPIKLEPGEKIPDSVATEDINKNVKLDKESYENSDALPGTDKLVGVNPLPATEGGVNPIQLTPGDKIPDSVTAEDINKNVKLDKESYEKSDALPGVEKALASETVSVNPLPAAEGAINPIKLAPGEKIPESLTTEDINKNVKLDKESYEKSDAIPGLETQLPPVSKNMIPESSLPITSAAEAAILNSAAPGSSTAALAAKVPLEPKGAVVEASQEAKEIAAEVPEAVKESIQEAGKEPEAAANPEAVEEKKAVEAELQKTVEPVPAAAETSTAAAAEEPVAAAAPAAATNGTSADKEAEKKKKKKNRLSTILSKIKHKLTS